MKSYTRKFFKRQERRAARYPPTSERPNEQKPAVSVQEASETALRCGNKG